MIDLQSAMDIVCFGCPYKPSYADTFYNSNGTPTYRSVEVCENSGVCKRAVSKCLKNMGDLESRPRGDEMEEATVERLTETLRKELNDAYRNGFEDAWICAKELWKDGTISFERSSTEMYQYAKKKREHSKEVERLAEKMGIHALYAEVVALRGEGNDPD